MNAMMMYLLTNPPAYRKLQQELDEAAAQGRLSSPASDAELRRLRYLQACVRETWRLLPPVATTAFYKQVPHGGDVLCGYALPAGTRVSTNLGNYGVSRSERAWGSDARFFRPERWLDESEERRQAMLAASDLIFGAGQFVCMGKAIAQMEVAKVLAAVLSFRLFPPLIISYCVLMI